MKLVLFDFDTVKHTETKTNTWFSLFVRPQSCTVVQKLLETRGEAKTSSDSSSHTLSCQTKHQPYPLRTVFRHQTGLFFLSGPLDGGFWKHLQSPGECHRVSIFYLLVFSLWLRLQNSDNTNRFRTEQEVNSNQKSSTTFSSLPSCSWSSLDGNYRHDGAPPPGAWWGRGSSGSCWCFSYLASDKLKRPLFIFLSFSLFFSWFKATYICDDFNKTFS